MRCQLHLPLNDGVFEVLCPSAFNYHVAVVWAVDDDREVSEVGVWCHCFQA